MISISNNNFSCSGIEVNYLKEKTRNLTSNQRLVNMELAYWITCLIWQDCSTNTQILVNVSKTYTIQTFSCKTVTLVASTSL